MDYRKIRDKLIGNNYEKSKLLQSDYLDTVANLFKTDVSDEDLAINLQIISALATTKNSNAKRRIRKDINLYFEVVKKHINAVVGKFNDRNKDVVCIYEKFIGEIVDREHSSVEKESTGEDPDYETYDWKTDRQKNPLRKKGETQSGQKDGQNNDNRFVVVDLEQQNNTTVQYTYDEDNNRFILQSDLPQYHHEFISPSIPHVRSRSENYESLVPSRTVSSSVIDINNRVHDDFPLTPRSPNENISTRHLVSNVNDRIDEILAYGSANDFNESQNSIDNNIETHNENSQQSNNRDRNRDDELVRLINYIHSNRRTNQNDSANTTQGENMADGRSDLINSNSIEYNEVHVPILNDVLGTSRLSTEDIERISTRFNDYRRGNNFLLALNHEFTGEGNGEHQEEDVNLNHIPMMAALNEATAAGRATENIPMNNHSNYSSVQILTTPVPVGGIAYYDEDTSVSNLYSPVVTDNECQSNEVRSSFNVNMKNIAIYEYPPQVKQDAIVSIFSSFFQIVRVTSSFSDDILLFALWFMKNDNSAFLEGYYRSACTNDTCMLLASLMIRKRAATLIDNISYISNFKLNEYNVKAYKEIISIKNVHLVDIKTIEEYISPEYCQISLEYLECYINYVKCIDADEQKAHYLKIVTLLKKNIYRHTKKALLLLSKINLHSEEVQDICNKKNMVEITIELFKQQIMMEHNPKYALLCIYSLCDVWEMNRKIILKQKIMPTIFDIFKQKLKEKNFDKEFLAIICLIKCMTRCVQFLRSELLEFPIVELFLLVIKYTSKTRNTKDLDVLTIFNCEDPNENELCSYAILKESFCVLSNLVMDHGNYKIKFINKNGLKTIYKAGKKANLEFYMLFLLKNFLYQSTWLIKHHFMDVFINRSEITIHNKSLPFYINTNNSSDLSIRSFEQTNKKLNMLENYLQGVIQRIEETLSQDKYYIHTSNKNIFSRTFIKYNKMNLNITNGRMRNKLRTMKELFNIIRNVVCSTKHETYEFFIFYPTLLENTILYFVRLLRSTNLNTQKRNIIIELLYVFSNICASTDECKDLFLRPFFTTEIRKLFQVRKRDIILAMIWFITNLSWVEDENEYERNKQLIEHGYRNYLIEIRSVDAYISDKVEYAIDNLNA